MVCDRRCVLPDQSLPADSGYTIDIEFSKVPVLVIIILPLIFVALVTLISLEAGAAFS